MLCQVAVLHAADDVGIAVEMSGGDWEWTKWLPHSIEPDAAGKAGVVPLVAAGPEDLADVLERELARRLEQAAARRNQIARTAALRRCSAACRALRRVRANLRMGRSRCCARSSSTPGPQSGLTLIFLAEREADEPSAGSTCGSS